MTPSFLTGNACLAGSILLASLGQVLLRAALRDAAPLPAVAQLLGGGIGTPRLLLLAAAGLSIVAGFVAWALCLRHLPVSYAYTVACSSVVLVAVMGSVCLQERWSPTMSLGAALILAGTLVLFADGWRNTGNGARYDRDTIGTIEAGP
jgi:drug/metabolite transporter (DMT)-like permease